MGFVEDMTPAQYRLQSLHIEQEGGEIVARFTLSLFNADGMSLINKQVTVPLTEGQRSTLLTFLQNKIARFEDTTGLTKMVK